MLKKLDAAKMESMVRVAVSCQWLLHAGCGSANLVAGCYDIASMCRPRCFTTTCACSRRQQCAWRLGRMMRTPMRARRAHRSPPPLPVRSGCGWSWECRSGRFQDVPVSNGHSFRQAERAAPPLCRHGVGGEGQGRPGGQGGRDAGEWSRPAAAAVCRCDWQPAKARVPDKSVFVPDMLHRRVLRRLSWKP